MRNILIVLAVVGLFGCASWNLAQKEAACNGFSDLAKLESARFQSEDAKLWFETGVENARTTCLAAVREDLGTGCTAFADAVRYCSAFDSDLDVGTCQRVLTAGKVICDIHTAGQETPEDLDGLPVE